MYYTTRKISKQNLTWRFHQPNNECIYCYVYKTRPRVFLSLLEVQWHVYAITYVDLSPHTQKITMMKNIMNIIMVNMHIKQCNIFVIL